ncbi:MAG: Helix-turn-helix domain [Verrucomicrobiales bacterium]|nr:Helix-turn-helix domain [Verrucomicrobiales bacterium]
MFVPAAIDDAGLSMKAFRVFATLCRRAGTDGKCFPLVETIAETTGLNRKTVFEALAELAERGFLIREARPGKSTNYQLAETQPPLESNKETQPEKRVNPENGPARKAELNLTRKTGRRVTRKTGHIRYTKKGIQEGASEIPDLGNPEGKVSGSKTAAAKAADPRHHEITSKIDARHQTATGEPLVLVGRDFKALQTFLQSWKGTAEEFLTTAEQAWFRARNDQFARHCLDGSSLAGLCHKWPQILAELARPVPAPPGSRSNSSQSSNSILKAAGF